MRLSILLYTCLCCAVSNHAQNSVDVTFRHYASRNEVVRAFVPGSFNNWGPNSNGYILSGAPSQMTYCDTLTCYVKTIQLLSGNTYEYKFHEHHNLSGTQWQWFTDPLNPLINYSNNNNSILHVEDVLIFEIRPSNNVFFTDSLPVLTAGIFAADGDSILPDHSFITINDSVVSDLQDQILYDHSILVYEMPIEKSGIYKAVIHIETLNGASATDSTQFTVAVEDFYFTTPPSDSVLASPKWIHWYVNRESSELLNVTLKQVDKYPLSFTPTADKEYEYLVDLSYGENRYVISVTDTSGNTTESDTLLLIYPNPQIPEPEILFELTGSKIKVTGVGNDPQNGNLTYLWYTSITNASILPDIDGTVDESFEIDIPDKPGDYAIKLSVTDEDLFSNTTVNFFTVTDDSSIIIPELYTVPRWVLNGSIYSMFIRGFTPEGTIQSAISGLQHIKNMGFNIVWVLPVMKVEGLLNQNTNIGYNIVDFYHVDPLYGTDADFKMFVQEAHNLGLRVLLDVTPNHSSRSHPLALDVRLKKKFSHYYDFYQHEIIPHNDNGLGQSISPDGIVYYSGFSAALLNWNWNDAEARKYMLDIYCHWLREYDIDGFRFDVYWGPHRRYGKSNFDEPLRRALRKAKADIMILGETSGTGSGTDVQYADKGGGMDLGYDWILMGATYQFPDINMLDNTLYNNGYRPGPNSCYLRFLENHDEYRVAYRYNSIEKTIPVSTAVFMATGCPLLYQGQEVGMGYEMSGSKEFLARSDVIWENPPAHILTPHYQKLAQIRAQFSPFGRQMEDSNNDWLINSNDLSMQPRLTTTSASIYAFGRPYSDQNGIVVINFSDQTRQFSLIPDLDNWAEFSSGFQENQIYYLNNLYQNTSYSLQGQDLDSLDIILAPFEVAIYTIALIEEHVQLPQLTVSVEEDEIIATQEVFSLSPNYPNPFNAQTTIFYTLPEAAEVCVEIFNLLGQPIKTLVHSKQGPGKYSVVWDGLTNDGYTVPSGVYLYKMQSGKKIETQKMLLLR